MQKPTEVKAEKDSREISVAFLREAVTIPGTLSGVTTLSKDKAPGFKFTFTDHGVLMSRGNLLALVPHSNIRILIFA